MMDDSALLALATDLAEQAGAAVLEQVVAVFVQPVPPGGDGEVDRAVGRGDDVAAEPQR